MSNASLTHLRRLLYVMLAMILAVTMGFALSGFGLPLMTANADENVLYYEDFTDGASSLDGIVTADSGAAVLPNTMFNLPVEAFPESNNVELDFDIKLNGSSDVYIHFAGLDGTLNANIFLGILGGGAYWRMSNQGDAFGSALNDVYNNSGDNQGGLNGMGVDLGEFASVRFLHYEGYMELWVNGVRRAVSHLSNFGNTNYMSRGEIEEGKITGIAIHAINANAVVMDNIKVKEVAADSVSYSEHSDDQNTASAKTFDLSAQNLYLDNFKVIGKFAVADATKAGYYPTIKLYGLNASQMTNTSEGGGQKEYSVNIQANVNGNEITAGIYGQNDTLPTANSWCGKDGAAMSVEGVDSVEYRVEVYGDNVDFYLNGQLAIETTFTELGLIKGHLQYVRIQSGAGGMYWTDFSYDGYENTSAIDVTASEELAPVGSDVVFNADLFGEKPENCKWYVNDVEQSEQSTALTLNDMAAGTYVVAYGNDTVKSNKVTVTIAERMVVITADKTTAYATDRITFTASEMIGDFTDVTPEWYVNGEKYDATGTTLELGGLAAGSYAVELKMGDTVSNKINVTVLASTVTVVTDKNSYYNSETAVFTIETAGIADGAAISWYVNGVKVDGATGDTFELALSDYEGGAQLAIVAEADGIKSDENIISVVYDVLDKIGGDENYKSIWKDEIKAENTYGTFSVGSDENGAYLFSEVEGRDTYYNIPATMPSSTGFVFSYKLWVPADVSGKYYVYPVLGGLNSKYPQAFVEMAVEVSTEGLRPYFKDQGNNQEYLTSDYGLGKDLSYDGGISEKGDWNTVSVAVDGQYISMYINGEMTLFFKMPTASVPSAAGFNFYPDGGTGVVPLRIKDIEFSGIVQPAPDLESVTLSLSSVSTGVNESVTVTANLNPFNAVAQSVEWYVNGEKAAASGLTFTFSASEAGEYEVYCIADGIQSASKKITVTAAGGNEAETDDGKLPDWGIALIVIGCAAVVGGVIAGVVIARKKK